MNWSLEDHAGIGVGGGGEEVRPALVQSVRGEALS